MSLPMSPPNDQFQVPLDRFAAWLVRHDWRTRKSLPPDLDALLAALARFVTDSPSLDGLGLAESAENSPIVMAVRASLEDEQLWQAVAARPAQQAPAPQPPPDRPELAFPEWAPRLEGMDEQEAREGWAAFVATGGYEDTVWLVDARLAHLHREKKERIAIWLRWIVQGPPPVTGMHLTRPFPVERFQRSRAVQPPVGPKPPRERPRRQDPQPHRCDHHDHAPGAVEPPVARAASASAKNSRSFLGNPTVTLYALIAALVFAVSTVALLVVLVRR